MYIRNLYVDDKILLVSTHREVVSTLRKCDWSNQYLVLCVGVGDSVTFRGMWNVLGSRSKVRIKIRIGAFIQPIIHSVVVEKR